MAESSGWYFTIEGNHSVQVKKPFFVTPPLREIPQDVTY
jgi:hypothetical protein